MTSDSPLFNDGSASQGLRIDNAFMATIQTNPPHPPQPPERSASLLGLILRGVVGLVVLVGVLAGVAKWVAPTGVRGEGGIPTLAETTLADGSLIEVVAVTVEQRHRLTLPRRANEFWERWLGRKAVEEFKISSKGPSVQVWIIQRRAGSARMVVFDEFRQGRITTPRGPQVNRECRTFAHGKYDTRSQSGPPPYKMPLSVHGDDIVVTALEYPLIEEPAGPLRLELLGDAGRVLGTLEVPVPPGLLPTRAAWVSLPLPQTVTEGTFTATLIEIGAKRLSGGEVRLNPVVEYRRGADLLNARSNEFGKLIDPFGNTSHIAHCRLDPNNSPWKLDTGVWLRDDFRQHPESVWVTPALTIPAMNTVAEMPQAGTIDSGRVQVSFERFCRGQTAPQPLPARAMENHGRIKKNRVSGTRTTYSTPSGPAGNSLLVNGDLPFLIAEYTGLAGNEQPFPVGVRDDLGRDVKFEAKLMQNTLIWFPQPLPDAKSLTFTFGFETRARFEFTFAPPEP